MSYSPSAGVVPPVPRRMWCGAPDPFHLYLTLGVEVTYMTHYREPASPILSRYMWLLMFEPRPDDAAR